MAVGKVRAGLLGFYTFLLCLGMLGMGVLKALSSPSSLPLRAKVQGIPVGGLTYEGAKRKLENALSSLLDLPVVLHASEEGVRLTWRELGAQLDLDHALREAREYGFSSVPAKFEEKRLREALRRLAPKFERPPRNARLVKLPEGGWAIRPEQIGYKVDLEATMRKVLKEGRWPKARRIKVVRRKLIPRIRSEHLRHISTVLGSYTTYFSTAQRNRAHNIRLVVKHLCGAVVMPGEVFSFNRTVGPRTRKRGYLPAPVFVNKEIRTGIGGGACQVSTTLYNAVLRAKLPVVERHAHSLPVTYVPPGQDATVVYGHLDFKFKNDTPLPVVVWGEVRGGRLTISILGHPSQRR